MKSNKNMSTKAGKMNPESSVRLSEFPKDLVVKRDLLSRRECEKLIALYDSHCRLSSQRDYCGNEVLYYEDLAGVPKGRARLERVARTVASALGRSIGRMHLESIFVAMLPPGGYHPAHADNERYDGGHWVPNHTPQRKYSAILYLNAELEGGDLCFKTLGIRIKPQQGLLVGFPSHHGFVHEVEPVIIGKRYSIPLWFTNYGEPLLRL